MSNGPPPGGRVYDWMSHIGETHIDGTPHVPNPSTVAMADVPFDGNRFVMDIWCSECGQSGAFSVDVDPDSGDIQWA